MSVEIYSYITIIRGRPRGSGALVQPSRWYALRGSGWFACGPRRPLLACCSSVPSSSQRIVPPCPQPRRPALCAAFVGTFNSKFCPQGYSQVTTEAACKSLAAIGGKSYAGSVNVTTLPPGCFWLTVGGGVYLNTHATGAAHANAQQLCAGAPPSHAQPRAPMRRHGGPVSTREYLTSSAELCARNAGAMTNIALYRPCIYKHVYTYTHTNSHTNTHTHTHTHTHRHTHRHRHTHKYIYQWNIHGYSGILGACA